MPNPFRRLPSERLHSNSLPEDPVEPATPPSSARAASLRLLGHVSPPVRYLFAGALVVSLLVAGWSLGILTMCQVSRHAVCNAQLRYVS